ncbi:MAG: DEAD/DEAH box helicase family protein [Verrucomicrobia bacterium]|nr:DEAD/DEAH box helicase family protein [Verrucomicrobiota bacterium]MCF7708914.1 DEAD/DEAH box helicase family protein [Verrucomicrobiota bacterium]
MKTRINDHSPPQVKIALFRSLFQGREDVYPRRFESRRTGKSGYQPACAHEWIRGVCEKPKVKCAECPQRRFLSVTDEVIRWHLSGRDKDGRDFVMGIYPMLRNESCLFLAVDFDKTHWQEDALAFLSTCRVMNLDASLERSQSGQGGHVWLFFEEPIVAGSARRLGAMILTKTMENRPDVGLDSYDRLFPNQDTLPQGGFGNLIALPLQKRARQHGNTEFLDINGQPYPDQWAYLASVRKIDRKTIEDLVHIAEKRGRIIGVRMVFSEDDNEPWTAPPSGKKPPLINESLPKKLEITLSDQIYIPKISLSPGLRNQLIRLAAFQNPEFYKAQAMRLPTYDKPRVVGCAEDLDQFVALPRGCLENLQKLFKDLNIKLILKDKRLTGVPLDVHFSATLSSEQEKAAQAMLAHNTGVLSATTAFGKTVIASWLIAQRRVNTLVLVHRRQLLEQWTDRLSLFLNLPKKGIGRIGGGSHKPNGILDIAIIQSLIRKGVVKDCVADYGYIIADECHHLSAWSFEQVIRRAKAKYVTGLSATVTRKDGHHPIIFMQCGSIRYCVDAKSQATARPFKHTVHVRPTSFVPMQPADPDKRIQFQDLYRELITDDKRNDLICSDILNAVHKGRCPLVLTERKDHLELLANRLKPEVSHVILLSGGMRTKKLREIPQLLASSPENKPRIILATGRYIGEGFDDPRLDTLFITLPVSWQGTISQYVGRLHRRNEQKCEVRVYDYADLNVPMLSRMFDRRCRSYEAIGYSILLPASAIPGWPQDVPLPVDTKWKNDYAASIRRLVRDGVDNTLAGLFVNTTQTFEPTLKGIECARSASEALLYRRLETLPETAGLFQLNGMLPIAFDGWGQMEVDLLWQKGRVAIELDGDQHLGDPDAYRRDRRKDVLLQENGYMVLRFLAEDISKRLDQVLDTILRFI